MNIKDPASVDYKIHPNWFKRMREVVDYCMKYPDLKVLMNTHNGDWDRACMEDSVSKYEPILFKVWTQIAENFRDYDERLMFGTVNEPGAETTEQCAVLCKYEQASINAIRSTGGRNAHRVIVYQAPNTLCTFYILYARRRFVGICSLFLGKQLFARTDKWHRPQFA